MIPHCGFSLHFLTTRDDEHFKKVLPAVVCLCGIVNLICCSFLFWLWVRLDLLLTSNRVVRRLFLSCVSSLYILDINPSTSLQTFSPILRIVFSFFLMSYLLCLCTSYPRVCVCTMSRAQETACESDFSPATLWIPRVELGAGAPLGECSLCPLFTLKKYYLFTSTCAHDCYVHVPEVRGILWSRSYK